MAVTPDQQTTYIGKCNFRGNEKIFGIKRKDRRQHMYVVGKTGVGKSVLLKNLALQDIRNGQGIAIIDPHGEFVEDVLSQIPPERTNDVIYFNPVDSEFPIGFNVLEVPDSKYKHLVVSDLLGIFTKIWANVWSARMEYILQNCIMALLDTPGTTLLGIPRLLVDKDYRQKIVSNVKDPVVKSFWVHEYENWRDQFRNEAIVPIQNKVNQFLNTSFIRNIVGQPKSSLNIPEVMNSGKILLVNVSKGRVGEDNAQLLGAMVITKIQLAAMERVRIPEEERKDFYLYVDEFQNFATDSFASILSEARKYRLNLIIAHQYVGQLVTDTTTKVRDAVFGNTGTMIAFRVGAGDAEFLETEFSPEFLPMDLINLPNYNIYLKLMVDGVTSRPFSAATLPPIKFETDPNVKEKIIETSRAHYAKPKAEVEEQITRWSSMVGEGDDIVGGASSAPSSGLAPGQLIETPCWNCGKTATVPFKPDGKRPVYCMDCLKQIEAGTLIPLPERMPKVGREKFGQSLDTIGIEFTAQPGARQPAPVGAAPRQDGFRQRGDMGGGGSRFPQREMNSGPRFPQREGQRPGGPERRFPERRDFGQARPRPAEQRTDNRGSFLRSAQPVVRVPQGVPPVSLSQLAAKEEKPQTKDNAVPKTSANKPAENSDLKKLLEETLKNVVPPPAMPPAPKKQPTIPEENSAASPAENTPVSQAENIVKPGDVIKFD